MKKLLVLVSLLVSLVINAKDVYIDPTYTGSTKTGTIYNPYIDIPDSTKYKIGDSLLLKKGTVYLPSSYETLYKSCYLGSYGIGEKPIITNPHRGSKVFRISGKNISIEGINFVAANAANGSYNLSISGDNVILKNCDFYGGHPSISLSGKKIILYKCNLKASCYDAIYGSCDTLLIKNTTITEPYYYDELSTESINANLASSIDLIHIIRAYYVYIDSCYLHNNKSGKYCIINTCSATDDYIGSQMIIKNTMIKGNTNVGCIFPANAYVSIDNCILEGSNIGIHTSSKNTYVTNTIIRNQKVGVYFNTVQTINNCLIENVEKISYTPFNIINSTLNDFKYGNGYNTSIKVPIKIWDIPVYIDSAELARDLLTKEIFYKTTINNLIYKLSINDSVYNELLIKYNLLQEENIVLNNTNKLKIDSISKLNNKYVVLNTLYISLQKDSIEYSNWFETLNIFLNK